MSKRSEMRRRMKDSEKRLNEYNNTTGLNRASRRKSIKALGRMKNEKFVGIPKGAVLTKEEEKGLLVERVQKKAWKLHKKIKDGIIFVKPKEEK